jgi:hypothetical protein
MSFAGTKGTTGTGNAPEFTPSGDLQISVFQNTEDHRYIVSFRNETEEPVQLTVEDVEGNKIYTENVNGQGVYNKRFDLVNLNNGEYTVKVGNKFNKLEKELIIK